MSEALLRHKEFVDFLGCCLQYDHYRRPSLQQLLAHPFVRKAGSDKVEPSFLDPNHYRQSQAKPSSEDRELVSCPAQLRHSLLDKKDRLQASLAQNHLLTTAPSPVKKPMYLTLQSHLHPKLGLKKMRLPMLARPPLQLSGNAQDSGRLPLAPDAPPDARREAAEPRLLQSSHFNSLPHRIAGQLPATILKSEHLSQPEDSLASKHWLPDGEAGEAAEQLRGPQADQSGVLPNLESQGTFQARIKSPDASLLRKQQNFTFEAVGPKPLLDSDSQPICQSQFLPISEHLFDEQLAPDRKRNSSDSSQQLLRLSAAPKPPQLRAQERDSRFQHVSIPLLEPNEAQDAGAQASRKPEWPGATLGRGQQPRLGFLNSEQEPRPKNSNIEDSTPNDIVVKKRTFDFLSHTPQTKPVSSNNFLRVDPDHKLSHATDLKVSLSRNTKVSQNPGLSKDLHSRLPFSGAKSVSGAGPPREAEDCSDIREEGRRISQIFFSNKTPILQPAEEKGTTGANSPEKPAGGFKSKRPRIALNLSVSKNELARKADTHLREAKNANFSFSFNSQSQDQPPVASDASFEQSRQSDAQL